MYSDVVPPTPFEVIHVADVDVMCDGGGGTLGHPRVYLHINPDLSEIACPYCTRQFVLQPGASAGSH